MNQQQQQLEAILRRLNEDRSAQDSENLIAKWLQTMFSPEIDSAHDELRKKRHLGEKTSHAFVTDVETWLRDNSKMIYWTRGIRTYGFELYYATVSRRLTFIAGVGKSMSM